MSKPFIPDKAEQEKVIQTPKQAPAVQNEEVCECPNGEESKPMSKPFIPDKAKQVKVIEKI